MSTPSQTWRFALASVFASASIAIAACGGDDEETTTSPATTTETGATGPDGGAVPPEAHIDLASGEVNGVEPDAREGTPPPPVDDSDLEAVADATGCDLKLDLPDELPKGGDPHLSPGQPAPEYATTPPTAGLHDLIPQADGAYLGTPAPTSVLHSLEHGRVAIQYSPDLPEDEQLLLKGIFDDSPEGMLLFPNPDMPYQVAVTAWTNLVGCDVFGEAVLDVVRDFRDEFRGKGPERIPL
jgi:Protein of unknown function (DUF3105)